MSSNSAEAIHIELEKVEAELNRISKKRQRGHIGQKKMLTALIEQLKKELNEALLASGGAQIAQALLPAPSSATPTGTLHFNSADAAPNLVGSQSSVGFVATDNDTQARAAPIIAPQVATFQASNAQAMGANTPVAQYSVGQVAIVSPPTAASQLPVAQVSSLQGWATQTPVGQSPVPPSPYQQSPALNTPYHQSPVLRDQTASVQIAPAPNTGSQAPSPIAQNQVDEALANGNNESGTSVLLTSASPADGLHLNSYSNGLWSRSIDPIGGEDKTRQAVPYHSVYDFDRHAFKKAEMYNSRPQAFTRRSAHADIIGERPDDADVQSSANGIQIATTGDTNTMTEVHQVANFLYDTPIEGQEACHPETMNMSADRYHPSSHLHRLNPSSSVHPQPDYVFPLASSTFGPTITQSQHLSDDHAPEMQSAWRHKTTEAYRPMPPMMAMQIGDEAYLMPSYEVMMASSTVAPTLSMSGQGVLRTEPPAHHTLAPSTSAVGLERGYDGHSTQQSSYNHQEAAWDDLLLGQVEEGTLGPSAGLEESSLHEPQYGADKPSNYADSTALDIPRVSSQSCPSESSVEVGTLPPVASDSAAATVVFGSRILEVPSPKGHDESPELNDERHSQAHIPSHTSIHLPSDSEIEALCDSPQLREARSRVVQLRQIITNLESLRTAKVAELKGFGAAFQNSVPTLDFSTILAQARPIESSIEKLKAEIEVRTTDLQDSEMLLAQVSQHERDRVLRSTLKDVLEQIKLETDETKGKLSWATFGRLSDMRTEARTRLSAAEERLRQSSSKFGGGVEESKPTTSRAPKSGASSDLESRKEDSEDSSALRKRRGIEHDAGSDQSDPLDQANEGKNRPIKKVKVSKKDEETRTEQTQVRGNSRSRSRTVRISASRIKTLASKAGGTDDIKKAKKSSTHDGDQDEGTAFGDESPIPGLTLSEFQELEGEGKIQLSEFLLAPGVERIHPSIRLFALKYQSFLEQSSYQTRELALAMHQSGQNNSRCRFHLESRKGKTQDGAGKYLVEGIASSAEMGIDHQKDSHLDCGCPIDDVLLEFFFWKTWRAPPSNPSLQEHEEGMADIVFEPHLRSFICELFRKFTRLTLDDIYEWAKSGTSFMTYTAAVQVYRLAKALREQGVPVDVGQGPDQRVRGGDRRSDIAGGGEGRGGD